MYGHWRPCFRRAFRQYEMQINVSRFFRMFFIEISAQKSVALCRNLKIVP